VSATPPLPPPFDVAIIGGALSGASVALLLLRDEPHLRVLIVEKSPKFTRRVGEATVEVSTYFLGRVLGLTQYLSDAHLAKQGLRFWFASSPSTPFDACSEIGGRYMARVPAFQVDRATLDEEVLRRAVGLGAELWRPASVSQVELVESGAQLLTVRQGDTTREVRARWVIDASGVAALLARQQGWWRPNAEHPTTSVWSRWTGVKDWDGLELARQYPKWAMACHGIRGTATNHFMGDGWWAWCIPLKGGDVSVGAVFDQRLVHFPEGSSPGGRLKEFLCAHPVGRELLKDAHWQEGDVHWRKNLPYVSSTFAGDGFALVGDAAGFLDPFYSPGMDWISFTSCSAVDLILAQRRGELMPGKLATHNEKFSRSYRRWFDAVYKDKYEYMGDFELLRIAFLLDLGFYYMGVASQPFRLGAKALLTPLFSNRPSVPFYHLMRFYNRRLAQMARVRRARGTLGRRNEGERFMFQGYTFSSGSVLPIARALMSWLRLELTEGWRSWFAGIPAAAVPARKAPQSA
jgi:flavin-dependent dehydrogenase